MAKTIFFVIMPESECIRDRERKTKVVGREREKAPHNKAWSRQNHFPSRSPSSHQDPGHVGIWHVFSSQWGCEANSGCLCGIWLLCTVPNGWPIGPAPKLLHIHVGTLCSNLTRHLIPISLIISKGLTTATTKWHLGNLSSFSIS